MPWRGMTTFFYACACLGDCCISGFGSRLGFHGIHTHPLLDACSVLKLYCAIYQGEQRVVSTQANIRPRLDACAKLAHENAASSDELPVEALYASALGITVAAVLAAAATLFVSHVSLLHT